MVENVEEFSPQFDRFIFSKLRGLGEGHIEVDPAWTTQDVASGTVATGNDIRIWRSEVGFKVLISGCPWSCIVRIEVDDRSSLCRKNQVPITCSGGAGVCPSRQQSGIHIQGKAGVPEENGEYVPAFCKALRSIFPSVVEGKLPTSAEAQLVPHVEIRRGAEQIALEEWNLRVAVPEAG